MSGNPQERARNAVWWQVGRLLVMLRERRGYSQVELAQRAGVSVDLLAAYEVGRERFPDLEALLRLSAALGVNLLDLVRQSERQAGVSLLDGVIPPNVSMETSRPEITREEESLQSFVGTGRDEPPGGPKRQAGR